MAYEEYANDGANFGKVLYQLCKIGIPVNIVDSLILQEGRVADRRGALFATYKWNEHTTPIFKFEQQYKTYQQLKQEKIYSAFVELNPGEGYGLAFHFSDATPENIARVQAISNFYYILDEDDHSVDDNFKWVTKVETPIENKLSRLQGAFGKRKK